MKLKVIKGDITTFKGDALVNAANTMLTGSGGIRVEANSITRYIPDEIKYPVWLNGKPRRFSTYGYLNGLDWDSLPWIRTQPQMMDAILSTVGFGIICEASVIYLTRIILVEKGVTM